MSTKQKRKYVKRGTALIKDVRTAELALRIECLERQNLLLRVALFIERATAANKLQRRSA